MFFTFTENNAFDIIEWLENIHLHEYWYWILNQKGSLHMCQFGKDIAYYDMGRKDPQKNGRNDNRKGMKWRKFRCGLNMHKGGCPYEMCQTPTDNQ